MRPRPRTGAAAAAIVLPATTGVTSTSAGAEQTCFGWEPTVVGTDGLGGADTMRALAQGDRTVPSARLNGPS